MPDSAIIYPAVALVLWTMSISLLLVTIRFRLVRTHQVSPKYFKLNSGAKMPGYHTRIEQNYANLFEFPTLFYALIAVLLASGMVDDVFIWMAWTYVVLRFVHSLIHTTYNHIIHRLIIFGTSCFLVVAMWIRLATVI